MFLLEALVEPALETILGLHGHIAEAQAGTAFDSGPDNFGLHA